jgi:hypothetical protein
VKVAAYGTLISLLFSAEYCHTNFWHHLLPKTMNAFGGCLIFPMVPEVGNKPLSSIWSSLKEKKNKMVRQ